MPQCAGCGQGVLRSGYSSNQLRKGEARRCSGCVGGGGSGELDTQIETLVRAKSASKAEVEAAAGRWAAGGCRQSGPICS